MAKKLGKALLFTALAGAAVAGGIAIYNKYKASTDDFDDDFLDFDDEDDDFDDDFDNDFLDNKNEREYVSIPRDDKSEEASDDFKVNVDVKIADTFVDEEDDFDTSEDEATTEDKSSDTTDK
ncbi:MAG: hypothetical protein IJA34_15350 [Lachnospiraceae bacterium]|nr:hypothetical protein [Lachnospiraceae bacterium]